MFARFRPNLEGCEKVINYSYRIWPREEEWKSDIATRTVERSGDPVSMPDELIRRARIDYRRRQQQHAGNAPIDEEEGQTSDGFPRHVRDVLAAIGAGAAPYPASSADFARDWWPEQSEEQRRE
ncbi:hypothetical protein PFISCL1PPCAC_25610, partial [Pristionchus fissidentatus]